MLVLGLDTDRGGYLINDPARDDERTFIHADALEAARHAKGTDEDLLLIPIYQTDTPVSGEREGPFGPVPCLAASAVLLRSQHTLSVTRFSARD